MTITELIKSLYETLKAMWQNTGKNRNYAIPPEIAARLRVQKLLDYYEGNHFDYLKTLINEQFSSARFKMQLLAQPNIRNIVKYLADTVPFTFREGVLIQAANKKDQTILDGILDDNRFDNFCRTLDKMVYICKTVFVKVSWRNDRVVLDIITPEHVKVASKELNPYEIEAIGYPINITDKNILKPKGVFGVWDESHFYYTNERGATIPNPENPDNINPYGIIPIVTFRETEPTNNEFWHWPGEELINTQDNLNVKLTYRNYLFKRFNIPIPVLKGKIGNGQSIVTDGSEIIQLVPDIENPNTVFEFVVPNTQMAQVLDVIEEEVRSLLIGQGIDPNLFIQSADRQSGTSISMMNAKLEERRAVAKLAYQYSLEELLDVIRIVWNTHNPDNLISGEKEAGGIEVKIPDPKTHYATASDKWMDYEKKLELNMVTPADLLLLERNDLLNKTEAETIIAANTSANRSQKLTSLFTKSLSG